MLVLLIPIFDTTLVTVSRLLSGRSAAQGGRDHSSHRLVAIGLSRAARRRACCGCSRRMGGAHRRRGCDYVQPELGGARRASCS